ncbi:MAG: FAD-dependent oxidoreductase [Hyphomicrobiales bacterium]|nr:FAD-dependent oxidoreductase [Hyphomicrobiales bacterium]
MARAAVPTILEPARSVPVYGEYDVVVLGGGPAGIAAAVAAGRSGRSTLMIERYGFLGGMGTAAGVTNFCGLHANVQGEKRRVVHGVADDLLDRIEHLGGLREPHDVFGRIQAQAYDTSAYKIAADELLVSAGVDILFHALASGLHMETPGRIGAVFVETKSGRRAVKGQIFIDCSGDGDLAAWAGAPFELGDGNGNMLYPSSMFRINAVDSARVDHSWTGLGKLMAEAERTSNRRFPRKTPIVRPHRSGIEWRANMTQVAREDGTAIDGTDADDLSRGEIIGRRQIADVFQFLKTVPGFENSYIVDIAPQIGIRETRRIVGRYMLSEDDVLSCANFEDTIGVNGWPIEAHVSGDILVKWAPDGSRGYNQLPFRMLLPQQVDNLLVAGRCASMTHMGQSAARVSGACFVMGQAAGTAADMAIAAQSTPEEISVVALQDRLQRDGAFLGRTEV